MPRYEYCWYYVLLAELLRVLCITIIIIIIIIIIIKLLLGGEGQEEYPSAALRGSPEGLGRFR